MALRRRPPVAAERRAGPASARTRAARSCLVLLVLTACASAKTTGPPPPCRGPEVTADEYGVYGAVLDHEWQGQLLRISDHATAVTVPPAQFRGLPDELRAAFLEAADREACIRHGIRMIPNARRPRPADAAPLVFAFSRVGFSRDRTWALVYAMSHPEGSNVLYRALFLASRQPDGRWVVVPR